MTTHDTPSDSTAEPRRGELDIEDPVALMQYLRDNAYVAELETPEIKVLAGGVSNKTVLVSRPSGQAWVVKQALPKLRVKVDWYCSPERIQREAEGMRQLFRLAPKGTIVRLVAEDVSNFLIVMEAVPEPHANWKTMLLQGGIHPDHFVQFGALLAAIHSRSRSDRADLEANYEVTFEDRSYFESLRLEPYYAYALTQVPEASFLADLIHDTRDRRFALVHGDYSPKNILVHDGNLILLDHEVIHFGDPAFDLGFSLTHILSKAHHLPAYRELLLSQAALYWETYRGACDESQWDPEFERFVVLHTLGCLLARVAGRSPLEYLSESQRVLQQVLVVKLATDTPLTIHDLIKQFSRGLERADH